MDDNLNDYQDINIEDYHFECKKNIFLLLICYFIISEYLLLIFITDYYGFKQVAAQNSYPILFNIEIESDDEEESDDKNEGGGEESVCQLL
jgi:hypothetical protein